jgi:hypothetical protein
MKKIGSPMKNLKIFFRENSPFSDSPNLLKNKMGASPQHLGQKRVLHCRTYFLVTAFSGCSSGMSMTCSRVPTRIGALLQLYHLRFFRFYIGEPILRRSSWASSSSPLILGVACWRWKMKKGFYIGEPVLRRLRFNGVGLWNFFVKELLKHLVNSKICYTFVTMLMK